jgi:hypothetical protein
MANESFWTLLKGTQIKKVLNSKNDSTSQAYWAFKMYLYITIFKEEQFYYNTVIPEMNASK